jgi:hypothetical protein
MPSCYVDSNSTLSYNVHNDFNRRIELVKLAYMHTSLNARIECMKIECAVRRCASKVIADAKQGCAGDSAITPYNLVISIVTLTTKHAEIAR